MAVQFSTTQPRCSEVLRAGDGSRAVRAGRQLALAWLLINPWARRQICELISDDAEGVSLSPAEGERAGVRGKSLAAIDQFHVSHNHPTPHPDSLPFRRGEGRDRRNIVYPTNLTVRLICPFLAWEATNCAAIVQMSLLAQQSRLDPKNPHLVQPGKINLNKTAP